MGEVTVEKLRELHKEAVIASRTADLARITFQQNLATYYVEQEAEPGLVLNLETGQLRKEGQ